MLLNHCKEDWQDKFKANESGRPYCLIFIWWRWCVCRCVCVRIVWRLIVFTFRWNFFFHSAHSFDNWENYFLAFNFPLFKGFFSRIKFWKKNFHSLIQLKWNFQYFSCIFLVICNSYYALILGFFKTVYYGITSSKYIFFFMSLEKFGGMTFSGFFVWW